MFLCIGRFTKMFVCIGKHAITNLHITVHMCMQSSSRDTRTHPSFSSVAAIARQCASKSGRAAAAGTSPAARPPYAPGGEQTFSGERLPVESKRSPASQRARGAASVPAPDPGGEPTFSRVGAPPEESKRSPGGAPRKKGTHEQLAPYLCGHSYPPVWQSAILSAAAHTPT